MTLHAYQDCLKLDSWGTPFAFGYSNPPQARLALWQMPDADTLDAQSQAARMCLPLPPCPSKDPRPAYFLPGCVGTKGSMPSR